MYITKGDCYTIVGRTGGSIFTYMSKILVLVIKISFSRENLMGCGRSENNFTMSTDLQKNQPGFEKMCVTKPREYNYVSLCN